MKAHAQLCQQIWDLLQKRFAESDELQFISITTDPDYDSANILREFSNKYSNKNNWFFLRGRILIM